MNPVELELGAKRCNAGEYSIAVEPNGDILPCQSYYVSAGNILRDPWDSIWRGELFVSFRDRETLKGAAGLPEKCWECPDLPSCGGGCRIEREARAGRRVARTSGKETEQRVVGFVPLPALRRRGRSQGTLAAEARAPAPGCGGGCGCAG
jgi:radical SAM protein with 4Fe4S-binding SPASM domain